MIRLHNLGFPRIGAGRELKFALESYWKGEINQQQLEEKGRELRKRHWQIQSGMDLVPVNDFSFYDHVEDMSFMLGNIPERIVTGAGSDLDAYFRLARGRSASASADSKVAAGEMTKWFDTNYHYIVPEFTAGIRFELNADRLVAQVSEACELGFTPKPVIIGPITYLWLGKSKDRSDRLSLLKTLLPLYARLLQALAEEGAEWVQVDEPILTTDLNETWATALKTAYDYLQNSPAKILLTAYFGPLSENLGPAFDLPVKGIHLDAIRGQGDAARATALAVKTGKELSLGVVDGRNIWRTDLEERLAWLGPIAKELGDRLWLAPSCSLLHVPVDLDNETSLDPELRSWLAFAVQKLEELQVLAKALNHGRDAVAGELAQNQAALKDRRESPRVNNPSVAKAVEEITPDMGNRISKYPERAAIQGERFRLPPFPTTTIGSFPQTDEIRRIRRRFKKGELSVDDYHRRIKWEIAECIEEQEKIGLDVLVHGEAERNDMVEYFGELLDGFAFTMAGWVQSYGSRCVKPPVIFGDVSRPGPMTVDWIGYAQSLTHKPVKGMLTGPVTILNWSFVRDDLPRSRTCLELALAIREEVKDLEKAGTAIIQIDEPALREGLHLRTSNWDEYLDWTVRSFRIAANGVKDETQIHTHMCYGEFQDIIRAITDLDADVITIETSRSDMELLDVFNAFHYPNGIGPGVYDIHSPNTPPVKQITGLIKKASERLPYERLWVNPDCGLKTRKWEEVIPALKNMVRAAGLLRAETRN